MTQKPNAGTKQDLFIFFLSCWTSAFLFGGGLCIYTAIAFGQDLDQFNLINIGLIPLLSGVALAVIADTKYRLVRDQLDQ